MLRTAAIVLAIAASGCTPSGRLAPAWVPRAFTIRPAVVQQWALLAREFETEFVMCLYGSRAIDVLHIDYAGLGVVRPSTSLRDRVTSSCPDLEGLRWLGRVHNHPSGHCFPSTGDVVTMRKDAALIDVVVCDAARVVVSFQDGDPLVYRYDGERGVVLPLEGAGQ